ncbi:vWA domain-containing protein [Chitinimonas lacunae]|uniref:von Willebrand factor type A domain-containing protein n=1 Tax=Chitinimonas lacunae TaxID=1963018 RepID=A0ABV8MVN2_9NEIS
MFPRHLLAASVLLLAACTQSLPSVQSEQAVPPPPAPRPTPAAPESVAAPAPLVARAKGPLADKAVELSGRSLNRMAMLAPPQQEERENYQHPQRHGVLKTAEAPVSTFSIDVDTGSYANLRRLLNQGRLPPRDAVRVEELINYFPYRYPLPKDRQPFAVATAVGPTPWNPHSYLLRVGIQAADSAKAELPPANLVFLVDVSGSMNSPDKLPLLKNALKLLVDQLRPQDRVSLVTYAGGTRVVLEPTPGNERARLHSAIDDLIPGGSTAGAAGIELAYRMARQGLIQGGINRILLATDGDFNVGITRFDTLKDMVAERRRDGVSLSTLGFGGGNYNDHLMEQLADAGDGAYSYIDTLNEAQKVLVDEYTSTLAVVARDVKIQLEFNPAVVAEYRQIGFENRALQREDFNNDQVDAGEIGMGHRVTALYEITLTGDPTRIEPLRYGKDTARQQAHAAELGFLRLRYKSPDGGASKLLEFPIARPDGKREAAAIDEDFRFAAAVAAFGQRLADGGKYLDGFDFDRIHALAAGARGEDRFGYRGEFLGMVRLAKSLAGKKEPEAQIAE